MFPQFEVFDSMPLELYVKATSYAYLQVGHAPGLAPNYVPVYEVPGTVISADIYSSGAFERAHGQVKHPSDVPHSTRACHVLLRCTLSVATEQRLYFGKGL